MSETIPDDIGQAVQALYRDVMFSTPIAAIDILSRALLAEREHERLRCAEIAFQKTAQMAHDSDFTRGYTEGRIAAAIAIKYRKP